MLFDPVGERKSLTSGATQILTWFRRNDQDEFHTCPRRVKCLSWEGTYGGEPPT